MGFSFFMRAAFLMLMLLVSRYASVILKSFLCFVVVEDLEVI